VVRMVDEESVYVYILWQVSSAFTCIARTLKPFTIMPSAGVFHKLLGYPPTPPPSPLSPPPLQLRILGFINLFLHIFKVSLYVPKRRYIYNCITADI
jgi:hypothetical protein